MPFKRDEKFTHARITGTNHAILCAFRVSAVNFFFVFMHHDVAYSMSFGRLGSAL
jgi:hypothetical protein